MGLAFQLVDDLLDFVASSSALGKPAAADLRLGLATAPVLFACEKVGNKIHTHHAHCPTFYTKIIRVLKLCHQNTKKN